MLHRSLDPKVPVFIFLGGGVEVVLICVITVQDVSGKPLNSDAAATSCTSRPTGQVQKKFYSSLFPSEDSSRRFVLSQR